ncbi:MAG: hypothetical protein QXW65_00700 [Candidatus Pacearchaeota archaeon]
MFKHMFPRPGDASVLEKPAPIGFIFEPKFDSIRVFLYKEKDNIALTNQLNIDILFKFPEMLDLPLHIKADHCVLDGVLVVFKDDKADSRLLQERDLLEKQEQIKAKSKKIPATFLVFDILEINGIALLDNTLKKRREILERVVENSELIRLCPSSLNGKEIWKEVEEKEYDGVIAKSLSSKYVQGRSWDWLKIKNFDTSNSIVAGMNEKTFLLGAYKNNVIKNVGELKKESSKVLESYLKGKIKKLETKEKIFDFPFGFEIKKIKWFKPEIVVKIRHEGFQEGKLKNPQLVRIRFDKLPEQCILEDET